MPDENTPTPPTPSDGDNKPTTGKPAGSVQPSPPPEGAASASAAKPATPAGTPAKTAGDHAPAAPAKPTGPPTTPWDSPKVATLKRQFGAGIGQARTYPGHN